MRVLRAPALVILPAAIAAVGLLAPQVGPAVAPGSDDGVGEVAFGETEGLNPADTLSAHGGSQLWFCPGVVGDHQVTLTNFGDEPRLATVRLLGSDGTVEEFEREVASAGHSVIAVNEMGVENGPSAVIEVDGAGILASRSMADERGPSQATCASQTGQRWVFASGDTSDGSNDNIVFMNPFPGDAVVEVEFVTRSGLRADSAEVLVRGRRTARLSVLAEVPLEAVVAVDARVVSGRVVAHRVARTSRQRTGVSMSAGVRQTSLEWAFPVSASAGASADAVERYVVYNPTDLDAAIDIDVIYDTQNEPLPLDRSGATDPDDALARIEVEPFQLDLGPNSVDELILSDEPDERIDRTRPYTVVVRSGNGVPVVVDQVLGGTEGLGLMVSPGIAAAATEWWHSVAPLTGVATELVVQNPGDESATVTVAASTGGAEWDGPTIELAPRSRQRVVLRSSDETDETNETDESEGVMLVRVESDQPVVAATQQVSEDGTAASSVPGVAHRDSIEAIPGALVIN